MIDIERLLVTLAVERPVFHSEADLQHALAWKIHQQCQDCRIRLEFKPPNLEERAYVDIWVEDEHGKVAIELKYKTRNLVTTVEEETFGLLNQSAQDRGRYDFLKDVERLERIVSAKDRVAGYAVLLTNDSAYWKLPRDSDPVDAAFRLHQDRTVTGECYWGRRASKGTTATRDEPIQLAGTYNLDWKDYAEPIDAPYGKFRYLLVRVGTPVSHGQE